jgi:hypothetical protein
MKLFLLVIRFSLCLGMARRDRPVGSGHRPDIGQGDGRTTAVSARHIGVSGENTTNGHGSMRAGRAGYAVNRSSSVLFLLSGLLIPKPENVFTAGLVCLLTMSKKFLLS